jgi:hypothetical protein
MKRPRPLLEVAIQEENWEAAALCLLLGFVRAAHKIPPETLEEMIELLSEAPHRRTTRKRSRGRA